MAKQIIWTKRANTKFIRILEYLKEEWGTTATRNFIEKTYEFLDILAEFPEIGVLQHRARNIRGFTLTKQVTIFYRIEKDKILLLNFFDNRQQRA